MPLLQYEDGPALLARMGGLTILKSVVETMYAVITTDPLLNPFFMNVAIERVREKLLLFLTYAFGGASEYYGRDISFIHRPLITQHGLGLQHFDRFVSHFLAACHQHHVDKAAVNEANMLLNATRPIFDPRVIQSFLHCSKAQRHARNHVILLSCRNTKVRSRPPPPGERPA
ncbi:globin-like protein [Haematococcus lacustris]